MLSQEDFSQYSITYHKGPAIPRSDGTTIEQHIYESPKAKAIVSYVVEGQERNPRAQVRIIVQKKGLFGRFKSEEAGPPKYLNETEAKEFILGWLK